MLLLLLLRLLLLLFLRHGYFILDCATVSLSLLSSCCLPLISIQIILAAVDAIQHCADKAFQHIIIF